MGARFTPVPDLEGVVLGLAGVEADLDQRAKRIADTTMAASAMAQRHKRRYGLVVARRTGRARRQVAAQGPFAHLDEWGSANSSPKGTMRRAAEREGRLDLEGSR